MEKGREGGKEGRKEKRKKMRGKKGKKEEVRKEIMQFQETQSQSEQPHGHLFIDCGTQSSVYLLHF